MCRGICSGLEDWKNHSLVITPKLLAPSQEIARIDQGSVSQTVARVPLVVFGLLQVVL